MTRQISVEEARAFFAHPSQLRGAMLDSPDDLPDWIEYWADGPVCGAFHRAPWEGCWHGHYGVRPDGWGRLVAPARRVLHAFSAHFGAQCIIGWTAAENRSAIAFAKRIGFAETGTLNGGAVICTEWRP